MTPPANSRAGQIPPDGLLPALGGRYRLVERIARGGMGEVWRAFDEVLDRPVAVKVLRPEYADEAVFLERFRTEARNTAALVHTGIAAVHDFGQASLARTVVPFIVMELVPGQPLSQIIERDGALDIDRALDLTAQAARALHAAHLGAVVHRDVKPANLLVTPTGVVKITDFGIARAGDAVPLTRDGTVMGTAHYLAPELVNGRGTAAAASDIYALGVVLYECLAGRRPFLGDNPLAVAMEHLNSTPPPIDGLHPAIAELLDAVLAKEPTDRPASAEAFAHRLLALRIELAAECPTPDTVAASIGEAADAVVVHRVAPRSLRRAGAAAGTVNGRHRAAKSVGGSRARGRRRPRHHRRVLIGVGAATLVGALTVLWLVGSDSESDASPSPAVVSDRPSDPRPPTVREGSATADRGPGRGNTSSSDAPSTDASRGRDGR